MKNYAFDLYGTLIDIRTNDKEPRLWKMLADHYSRYGVPFDGKSLRREFLRIETDMRRETAQRDNTYYPEIEIERVFRKLYRDHRKPGTSLPIAEEEWIAMTAGMLRSMSMRKFRLYPGVKEMLERLRAAGCRVFLLSNAQRAYTMAEIVRTELVSDFEKIYISSDYDVCKPDPRFLRKLLEENGLDPQETAMVGNEPQSDMAMAALCGAHGILFNSGKMEEPEIQTRLMETTDRYQMPRDAAQRFLEDMQIIRDYREWMIDQETS